ncbi:uncharacterized protein RJT20DRAFT_144034 [Scheffersomyces xylosifermentans]|uniref:uncharacterized protein n=1 Tax=Scheffersomyces xylosifermentans TaxID=1304137 RepID=UPI00315D0CE2
MTPPTSSYIISWVIPAPTLSDLSGSSTDIDNDIDLMLNYLQPYFPPSLLQQNWRQANKMMDKVADPSQRIRAAIRSCLKDDANQLEFVRLYQNSINAQFNGFFDRFYEKNSGQELTFLDYFYVIKTITTYYNSSLMFLNLSPLARDLCTRNFNSLFYNNLIIRQKHFYRNRRQNQGSLPQQQEQYSRDSIESSPFLRSLSTFLDEYLFKKALTRPFSGTVNVIDVLSTLISINMIKDVNQLLIQLSIQKIKQFILSNCSGIWDRPLLESINEFIQNEIYPNFSVIVSYSADTNLTDSINNVYLYDLIKIAHDELVSLRIKEIYSIISEYPRSTDGLYELYQCLSTKFNHHHYNQTPDQSTHSTNVINDITNLSNFSYLANYSLKSQAYQRAKLVDTFIELCYKNLLHSGANTVDVITTYTKTIKSFLIVDPKGVLLDKVVRPIRRYLKTREDIIIKIVHGLLNDSPSSNELIELARELRKMESKSNRNNSIVEDSLDLNWIPDPIDALPDFKKGKVSDIIESLISIFDSNEIFIEEFTKLFGQRLLDLHNYDVSDIEEHLDLLKSRFGKNEFTTLDIMIRDIKESRVINEIVRSNSRHSSESVNFHTSILSHLYWPSVLDSLSENDTFNLPSTVSSRFEDFNENFSIQKKGRYLKFLPSIGLVKLNLEFKNKTSRSFEVTPDKAAILSLFNEKSEELSVDFIAKQLNMTSYMVSKGLSFWVKEGILLELTKTLYIVNEDDEEEEEGIVQGLPFSQSGTTTAANSATSESIPSSGKFKEFENLWPYLRTMLENISSLSSERVMTLLKLTIPKEKFNFSAIKDSQLEDYLDWLVDEEKLEIVHGSYKLKK